MAYLREVFEAEPTAACSIAMGLAQQPEGENWPLLVRSLSIVEGTAAQEVLVKLAQVDQAPDEPEAYRQVILRGLMLRDNGGQQAVALLEKWTGQRLEPAERHLANGPGRLAKLVRAKNIRSTPNPNCRSTANATIGRSKNCSAI